MEPTSDPPVPRPAALSAFLHGIEPRAWVLAVAQCGSEQPALPALEAALRDFAADAAQRPLAQWPLRFWSCLLAQPALLAPVPLGAALAELGPGPRAALLLRLIAGLDFDHASQVLGVSASAYEAALQQALDHPAMDDARIQLLREHLHDAVHSLPAQRREQLVALRERVLQRASSPVQPGFAQPAFVSPGWRTRRWPWFGLAGLAVALLATFLWPGARQLLPGQSVSLPVEAVPPPPTLTDSVIVTHPDYAQLAAPADAQLANELALLSWLASSSTQALPGPAPMSPPPAPERFEALPAPDRELLGSARGAWAALDAATRSSLLVQAADWRQRSPAQRAQLRQAIRDWDRLAAPDRARRRGPFAAWQALDPSDRERVRAASRQLSALPPAEVGGLRTQFNAAPADTQRMWWLGPALGQEMAPIASMFAFVPESDRPALLAVLRSLDVASRNDLATLAPRLTESRRQALRRDLLQASPGQRAALIRQRLAQ